MQVPSRKMKSHFQHKDRTGNNSPRKVLLVHQLIRAGNAPGSFLENFIWKLIRMPSYKQPCRYCNQLNPPDSKACPFCGRVNPVGPLRCPNCQSPIQKDWKACSGCGLVLETSCPSCGKTTFLGDYCSFCNAQLVVICGNSKCKAEQKIGRQKCIKCGKPLRW
jgi:RNA polymerase subunit RPABC4/transcription elongation factor Spt4